ncbi:MAG: hypothetical protein Q4A79_00955 [Candidatus Saccharibacteria bacterium]|nr:hypothetical protein [Candidatus Saccharibacteria bacterium]
MSGLEVKQQSLNKNARRKPRISEVSSRKAMVYSEAKNASELDTSYIFGRKNVTRSNQPARLESEELESVIDEIIVQKVTPSTKIEHQKAQKEAIMEASSSNQGKMVSDIMSTDIGNEAKKTKAQFLNMDLVNLRLKQRKERESTSHKKQLSAKEIKQREIQKALAYANTEQSADKKTPKAKIRFKKYPLFTVKHFCLATVCSVLIIFGVVWLVRSDSPDPALRVAAIQNGIEASYPTYIPRDYNLSNIVSENGKIKLDFSNSATGGAFSIEEERSNLDSVALLNNYVVQTYGDSYVVVKERGLTIYVGGSGAAWVNGGIVYKISVKSGTLTKKQLKAISVSM